MKTIATASAERNFLLMAHAADSKFKRDLREIWSVS